MNTAPNQMVAGPPWSGLIMRAVFAGFVLSTTWFALGDELFIRTPTGLRLDEGVWIAVPIVGLLAFSLKRPASHPVVAHLVAYARTALYAFAGWMGCVWVFDRTATQSELWGLAIVAAMLAAVVLSTLTALVSLILRRWENRRGGALPLGRTLLAPFFLLYAALFAYLALNYFVAGDHSALVHLLRAASSASGEFRATAVIVLLAPSVFAVYWLSLPRPRSGFHE